MLDPGDHHHHVLKKLPLDMHVMKVDLRSPSYLSGARVCLAVTKKKGYQEKP